MLASINIISLIIIITAGALARAERTSEPRNDSASNPLIYQRLRFEDEYLEIYRRYQKYLKIDEKKVALRINDASSTDPNTSSHQLIYEFYQNDQVESTSITQDDLIFEALDRSYKTRMYPSNVHNYDRDEDKQKASDPKLTSEKRCHRDLNFLLEQLDALEKVRAGLSLDLTMSSQMTPELLAFFDSFAGEESGLLLGNYHWAGNWRECTKRRILSVDRSNLSRTLEFNGRYCLASIRSAQWTEKINQRIKEMMKDKYFKYAEQPSEYARFFRIELGMCLPESCDSRVIDSRRADIHKLAVFKLSKYFRSYQLADLFCLPDETSELRKMEPSGQTFIYSLVIWLSVILICSICDVYSTFVKPETALQRLVDSMSMFRNLDRLLETASCQPPSAKEVKEATEASQKSSAIIAKSNKSPTIPSPRLHPHDLQFINAIKVVTTVLVLFGHIAMLFKYMDRNVIDYNGLENDLAFHIHASGVFFVDWYFTISGFLTTYIFLVAKKAERNSLVHWIYTIFHRYWRLAPLYIILFWFTQSVFMYTSYGPTWDYGTTNMTLRSICRRESWIYPLTLTTNLHPLHESCVMPAWYIASDMQFFLITPLVLLLLHNSPRFGWLTSLGAIGVCLSLRLHRYLTDERIDPLELMRPKYDLVMRNNWDVHPTYIYPQYRISSYLVGILAGHYTYMVLSGAWTSKLYVPTVVQEQGGRNHKSESGGNEKLASVLRFVLWTLGLFLIVVMMFATWFILKLFPEDLERHVKYFTAIIYAFDHLTAGLGMALILVTFMLGQFERLKQWMSHPSWTVLSRVNYIIFLTQVEWIWWTLQSGPRTEELSLLEVMKLFFCLFSVVCCFSPICVVLLEMPLNQLERNFIGGLLMRSRSGAAKSTTAKQQGGEMTKTTRDSSESSRLVGTQQALASKQIG